ncbi:Sad1/UNC domain protein [Aspergillus clavatus NRRL 1]|uniref:SUN domain-containing protein n=1 Tax=Aspergillus clavatus (strain ATCC 1007 / CBS 513.65 / DSM 816 / NCTC 3887 / NRRL 1 / QM 1276 / 107) TaxID=344612 RepID=A1C9Z0_ASPCL|nr:uncharacterized protein ACLA_009810 [Aspergillus clavatus NRRL 1]EAW12558.1 conserved hypothetical protein [Aspergillus clavatus NRRL 1]
MIRDRCAGAFLLIHLTILFFIAIGGVAGKSSSSQPVCLARTWRDTEADFIRWPVCVESRWSKTTAIVPGSPATVSTVSDAVSTPSGGTASSSASQEQEPEHVHDPELDTDSPLDNVQFLSFEDWKKQNLAKAGQSAENVGGSRRGGVAGAEDRHRPTGISNALDSLGEDAEIELDFGGFGADAPEATRPPPFGAAGVQKGDRLGAIGSGGGAEASAPSPAVLRAGTMRRKDAGTTCKERFNYASFDCAATVLKTNPECQGSSSVLIENKDSYMLNECRASNKFLILELCDDILVDTVVLANYEFFSSIFHTFRISVSDRYPAKMDQWRELGVYEARNTREVQAFAVENPLIWARYLKIEFLTHYGNEFYCPLSLIRVHGTTMLEEYKHDGEAARGDDEMVEESLEPGQVTDDVESAKPLATPSIDPGVVKEPEVLARGSCLNPAKAVEALLTMGHPDKEVCGQDEVPVDTAGHNGATFAAENGSLPRDPRPSHPDVPAANEPSLNASMQETADARRAAGQPGTDAVPSPSSTTSLSETAQQDVTFEADQRATAPPQEEHTPPSESTKTTVAQPPSPTPPTQESFFKSVNKRLQMLESNSTLSLLYIEEQSRILRDAFSKVEKRQLAKTSTFLETLNVTVLNELRDFRDQYDQVWKTVALEFENQRIQYHQELFSLSAQLGVLADELVFQKRVAVIQSIMVLFCFGLVLFSRGAVSSYIELPSVQNMVSRSYSLRSSSPPFRFGSPSASPGSTRPASSYHGGHRRNASEDSQDSPPSPPIAYAPPTPTSETSSPLESIEKREPSPSPNTLEMPEIEPPHLRSQSSPPVLKTEEEDGDGNSASSESMGS